jgi:hypothetical protein
MEKKNNSPSVAKKAAPTTKMIAALVAISKIRMYQHTWLESSNLVEIMSHQFLSEYHVDTLKFNNAIGRSALFKNSLHIREKNPTGICRDSYRPSSKVPRKVCYYLMEQGDSVRAYDAGGKKTEQWYTAIKYLQPASNTTRSSSRSMEDAESSQPTKRQSTDKSENRQFDAEQDGPPTKKTRPHYKEPEGECPPTSTIEQAYQEIIRDISLDDLQSLKLLVDNELIVRLKAASDLGIVSPPSSLSSKQVGLLTQQSKSQGIEKQVSPISKSLEIFGPRHAKGVIVARKEGNRRLVWDTSSNYNPVHHRTIEKKAAHLAIFLNVMAGQNAALASHVLRNVLEKKGMEKVKGDVQKLSDTDTQLDAAIVDNIKSFLEFHKNEKGGTLKLDEQMAVQAVKQAISFFDIGSQDTGNISNRSIASRLGYCSGSGHTNNDFNDFRESAREMQLSGERFERRPRNTRSDCYRLAAKQCVWDYVHSDEGSRLDSNSFYVYEVRHPTTEAKTKCPQRIWNEITLEQKYESFQESSILKAFQIRNPGKGICKEVFRISVCRCVRKPSPQSCVDLLMSGLYWYQKAINDAIKHRLVISMRLKNCKCVRHTTYRHIRQAITEETLGVESFEENCEELPKMWEEMLSNRPVDLIASTCCDAVEELTLCTKAGEKPPKVIRWRCWNQDLSKQPRSWR